MCVHHGFHMDKENIWVVLLGEGDKLTGGGMGYFDVDTGLVFTTGDIIAGTGIVRTSDTLHSGTKWTEVCHTLLLMDNIGVELDDCMLRGMLADDN